ncbi:DUF3592 domain-containing protein [Dactylosporangium sp. CS-047395]|uniref:DUF3592 domain-containing protein n=1 Tax=Dactylosporangium sp. CS-047395 TaxID=3239936 RepID=UPI003D8A1B88
MALGLLIVGAAVVVLGIVAAVDWYTAPGRLVREGVAVPAVVEQVSTWGGARTGGAWIRIRYEVGGVTHRVGLGSIADDAGVTQGDTITVYVDRGDPERVVTGTGLVSNYRSGLLRPLLVTAGAVTMGIAGPRVRRRASLVAVPAAADGRHGRARRRRPRPRHLRGAQPLDRLPAGAAMTKP